MIYYELFSTVKVFEEPRLNVFFNQLFTGLINSFSEQKITENLIIDGKIALLMQEERDIPLEFSRIELITNDLDIFNYLKANLKLFDIKDYQFTDDEITVFTNFDYVLYFNYSSNTIDTVVVEDIYVRNSTEIL